MEKSPIRSLIDSWPTRREFAEAVGAPLASVHKWADYDRIPARWQAAVVRAAQREGRKHVTPEWMLDVHSRLRAAE